MWSLFFLCIANAQIVTINGIMGDSLTGNFNVTGSVRTRVTNDAVNATLAMVSDIAITTLDVGTTTLPATNTTCPTAPLAASCIDGSLAPACTVPVSSACLPTNYTVASLTVTGNVNATNAYITLMQNQSVINANNLTALGSTIVQGGPTTCSSTLPSSCFDVSGYMCAINQTLPANCYPQTKTFVNATSTNTLRIGGTLVCPNGPITNTSCLPTRIFSINGVNATNFTVLGTNGISVTGGITIAANGTNSVLVQGQVVTTVNFLGSATVTAGSGATTNVNINSPLTVQKNTVSVGTPSTINFVGRNVVASGSGNPTTNVYVQNTIRPIIRDIYGPAPGANISVGSDVNMTTLITNDGSTSTTAWFGNAMRNNGGYNFASVTIGVGFITITYTTAVGSVQLCPYALQVGGVPVTTPTSYVCGTIATPSTPGVLNVHARARTYPGTGNFAGIRNNGPTYWVPGANDRVVVTRFM